MSEPALKSAAHCINPDCQRPIVRSLAAHFCPTCKTTLRLNERYIPLAQLSSNRYTATYQVYDLKAKTEAILKVLIEPSPRAVELFRHTAKVLSSMRWPGLPRVTVKSYFLVPLRGSVHSIPCFVMEEIQGKSLETVIAEYPSGCPEAWVMEWLKQMVDALQFIHSRQLVHGNLAPENVLLRDSADQVVLIGFGNPKSVLSAQAGIPGNDTRSPTQAYRPPEQNAGTEPTASADLFALGRICIHLLTGVHPLDLVAESTGKLRWQHRARVNSRFAELLDQLTHPSANGRFQTATEVKSALAELMASKEKPKSRPRLHRSTSSQPNKRKVPAQNPVTVMQDVQAATTQLPALADAIVLLIQMMLNIAVVSALTTGLGIWLVFYSPLAQIIRQGVALGSRSLTFTVTPTLALFMLVGMGTIWGMMNLHSERLRYFWLTSLLGSAGYGFSWISWQWADLEHPSRALGRVAAISALFFAVALCPKRHWLVHVLVTVFGTALTISTAVRLQLFRLDYLYALFSANFSVPLQLDISLITTTAMFFASLGAAICFWSSVSDMVVNPIMTGFTRKRV